MILKEQYIFIINIFQNNKSDENSGVLTLIGTLEDDFNEIKLDINERFDYVNKRETQNNNEIVIQSVY